MKNLNENPFAWFILAIFLGGLAIGSNHFSEFIVFMLAVILSKQIEIIGARATSGE